MNWLKWFFGPSGKTPWDCSMVYADGSVGELHFWATDGRDALDMAMKLMPVRPIATVEIRLSPRMVQSDPNGL